MTQSEKESFESKVLAVLETVKPYLQADGGDISLAEITDDFTIKVRLLGACHACPMSIQTLKLGVEQALKNALPEVKKVVAI